MSEETAPEIPDLEDGIYFGLPIEVYLGQNRMSSSGVCNMLTDPATFWANSWLNPDRERTETAAQIAGTAYHAALFEPAKFARDYRAAPDPADYPEAVMTASEVMAILKEMGEKQTIKGEQQNDRARRLVSLGFDRPIWSLIVEEWEAADPDGLQIGLPRTLADEIARDVATVRGNKELLPFITDGEAEVTILWTGKDGTRWKSRPDYLQLNRVVDLKTFDNVRRKNLDQCIADAVAYERYYIQATLSWQAAEQIRVAKLPIKKIQNQRQKDLVEAIRNSDDIFEFWWIFQQKKGVPNVLARQFRLTAEVHPHYLAQAPDEAGRALLKKKIRNKSRIFEKGTLEIEASAQKFRMCSEIWPDGPWGVLVPVSDIDDEAFSPYFLEN